MSWIDVVLWGVMFLGFGFLSWTPKKKALRLKIGEGVEVEAGTVEECEQLLAIAERHAASILK